MAQSKPLAIFLSPHFDDIALSCGGIAARLSRMGARCIGLTVCAAPHPEGLPLSSFAQRLHSEWEAATGMPVQAINEVRREEERQALRVLGLEPVWLDVPDAPYRRLPNGEYPYHSEETLFGGRLAKEERGTLVRHVASEISRVARETGVPGPVRVFAPLGVGRHVDHRLVFSAARLLPPRYGLLFYEDYPYAGKEGALEARLLEIALPARPRLTNIADLIGVKIAAIARYKSQLEMLFGSPQAMPSTVRSYFASVAASTGANGYAERVWRLPSEYTLG